VNPGDHREATQGRLLRDALVAKAVLVQSALTRKIAPATLNRLCCAACATEKAAPPARIAEMTSTPERESAHGPPG
jgi:hypothetical protein